MQASPSKELLILYDRHTVWGDLDLTLPPVLFNKEISDIKPMMRRKALARIQLARSYTLITLKCHRFFGIVRGIDERHRYDPVFFRGDHAIAGIAQSTARLSGLRAKFSAICKANRRCQAVAKTSVTRRKKDYGCSCNSPSANSEDLPCRLNASICYAKRQTSPAGGSLRDLRGCNATAIRSRTQKHRPIGRCFCVLERITGLEPATSTLARSRSTK